MPAAVRSSLTRWLLAPDDPIHAWRGRMLALYDGLAGRAKGYAA